MKKIIFTLITALFAGSVALSASTTTINPTADGFVKQADDTYVGTFENMELSSYIGYVREIFLDFDLTDVTFTPEHATLKLYVNSYSNANPVIIAAYAKTGNAISESLTFTTRPTADQYKTTDIHASQDSVGKWLSFDFADFIKTQDFSVDKLLYFRIAIVYPPTTSSTSPLITIGSIESSNKPQLILNDAPVAGVYEVPYAEIETLYVSVPYNAVGNPVHAFNGAGLLPDMKHVTAADNMAWRNSSGSFPINLMAKIKTASNIVKLHIWNFNWMSGATNYTNRGVNGVNIYISTSSDDMTSVAYSDSRWVKVSPTDFHLTQAPGLISYGGDIVEISGAEDTRWIAFNVLSNFTTTNYAGLSEVKIYKEVSEVDPGPTTAINDRSSSIISVVSEGSNLVINLTFASKITC